MGEAIRIPRTVPSQVWRQPTFMVKLALTAVVKVPELAVSV